MVGKGTSCDAKRWLFTIWKRARSAREGKQMPPFSPFGALIYVRLRFVWRHLFFLARVGARWYDGVT